MDQTGFGRPAHVDGLLERVEHEPGTGRLARPPADNAPGDHVDDERDVDHARPGRHVGEVAHPLTVRRRSIRFPKGTGPGDPGGAGWADPP
jgi:hypothetical protein